MYNNWGIVRAVPAIKSVEMKVKLWHFERGAHRLKRNCCIYFHDETPSLAGVCPNLHWAAFFSFPPLNHEIELIAQRWSTEVINKGTGAEMAAANEAHWDSEGKARLLLQQQLQ